MRFSPLAAILLAGCAAVPKGPDVAVMPGPGKSIEQFENDDRVCRDYADKALTIGRDQAGANSVAQSAAAGTVLGAAAGALLGMGHGGAVAGGAGMGLVIGSAVGAQGAGQAEREMQRRYDIAYEQCMSTKGNRLPAPPVSYYGYRRRPRRVIIYQQPPPDGGLPPPAPPSPAP